MGRYDILVVGGGINGCGIARDAAGRGHAVLLAEQGDLGGATSSASTKLIHGGLRYLEYYEFRLVRKALIEREVLLEAAPHIIWPMRFVLPHHDGLRPAWLLRLGLFLYDHLGGRKRLPATRSLDLHRDPAGAPLQPHFTRGFEYSDCWVEDSRLVVLNAIDAAARGADIRPRTRVVAATPDGSAWRVTLRDAATGAEETVAARTLINAAGPWAGTFLGEALKRRPSSPIRLVKGSHIVVPRLFEHDRAYIFQNADGRIVFAIPYETDFTLVGTTDEDYRGDPGAGRIGEAEIEYLCRAANGYFRAQIGPEQVVWSFSGVRPLYDDGASAAQAATRDYVLELEGGGGSPALLTVIGGKITTYRVLAEAALKRLAPHLAPDTGPWTARVPLPGGAFPVDGFPALVAGLRTAYPFLDAAQAHRLGRAYGTQAAEMLGDARAAEDLGRAFGAGLSECELVWLAEREWARTAEDVVWRRSKLGLRLTPDEIAGIDAFLAARAAAPPAALATA